MEDVISRSWANAGLEPVLVAFRLVQGLQEVKPLEYFFLSFSIQKG